MNPISIHQRLHPMRLHLIKWFVIILLTITAISSTVMLIVAIINVLPLLVITVGLLVALNIPLLLLTSLHPAIEVHESGLRIQPLVWPDYDVSWEELSFITPHTLLPPEPPERQIIKKMPPEGLLIVGKKGPWHSRVVGLMTGQQGRPTFAVASHTHHDYKQLRHHLKQALPFKEQA